METLPQRCVLQYIRLVTALKGPGAGSRDEPQAQNLSGLFDDADHRHVGVPAREHCTSASEHFRAPVISGTGGLHDLGGAHKADSLDAAERLSDDSRVVPVSVVLEPAQHEPESVFWVPLLHPNEGGSTKPCPSRGPHEFVEESQ